MTVAFVAICAVFAVCELLHFRRESELIRRLATRDHTEYRQQYEKQDPLPSSPSRDAMKRWKTGDKL
jgi:hypothetical protein